MHEAEVLGALLAPAAVTLPQLTEEEEINTWQVFCKTFQIWLTVDQKPLYHSSFEHEFYRNPKKM